MSENELLEAVCNRLSVQLIHPRTVCLTIIDCMKFEGWSCRLVEVEGRVACTFFNDANAQVASAMSSVSRTEAIVNAAAIALGLT